MINIIDLLSKEEALKIDNLVKKYDNKINEFEVSFFGSKNIGNNFLTLDKFNQLNSVLSIITEKNEEKYKKKSEISLDIIMRLKEFEKTGKSINYRVSINDLSKINEYLVMLHMRKNHLIFSILVGYVDSGDEVNHKIKIIKKIKNYGDYIELDDVYMKIKMDNEEKISTEELKKLKKINKFYDQNDYDIFYRLKERNTYYITKDKNVFAIDLTNVRASHEINLLEKIPLNYEIEAECNIMDKSSFTKNLFSVSEFIIKVIQQSNYIITKSMSNNVISKYRNILGIDEKKSNLYGRQPISLEVQHIADKLPNKYTVTDKADGDRHFLIIIDERCYLLTTNLIVKDTGLNVDKKYNNSIIDGELIFLQKKNKYLYMCFDCIIHCNNNVRDEANMMKRLEYADDIIMNINKLKYEHKYLRDNKKLDFTKRGEMIKYHHDNLVKFYDDIDNEIKSKNVGMIIRRKYFIEPNGVNDNEIFAYSSFLWKSFTNDSSIKCPYLLDGLIYQPLEQKYIVESEKTKLIDYKWKPPFKNSIDFYIEFEKDKITGKILTIYDNSIKDVIKNKPYQICNLYVGQTTRGVEKPVLFNTVAGVNQAYIYLNEDGNIHSTDGKQIFDKTVVEFIYHLTDDMNDKFRWIPIKTRYDKTESVQKFQKKYGNYLETALLIWRSINNPILMEDFNELSNDNMYDKTIKKIRDKIDFSVIKKENTQNVYYQKKTGLIKDMGAFHNYIKSNLIHMYMNPYYVNKKIGYKILDLACGRGGDLQKFYYVIAELVIGIDMDTETLLNSSDGAVSRYKHFKKTKPNYPPMYFVTGTPNNILQYDEQIKIFGNLNNDAKHIYEKYFSFDNKRMLFDRFNCGFAIHYFLSDENSWNNFCTNINMYLHDGGYFIFQTFDGNKIKELLKGKNNHAGYYDENGEKKKLFDIVKKYDDNDKRDLGIAIDVHMSWLSEEGVYLTEYLVYPEFIIKSFKEKCNLMLVETDSFENMFNNNRSYLELASKIDATESINFYGNIYKFYTPSEINSICYEYSFLNRYYVFRKAEANLSESKTKFFTERDNIKNITGKLGKKNK